MSLVVTEAAAQEVKKHKDAMSVGDEAFLRIGLVAGGCSGHKSRLTMDKNFDESKDSKYSFFGVDVVIDKKSELYLDEAKLDFVNGLEASGFHLDIPSAKKSCGCGTSYQF